MPTPARPGEIRVPSERELDAMALDVAAQIVAQATRALDSKAGLDARQIVRRLREMRVRILAEMTLAARQEPLGSEFEAVWDQNTERLYEP